MMNYTLILNILQISKMGCMIDDYISLSGADLREADLRGADLREANLNGASLREANLNGASLLGADLRDADLREANLNGASLREANLNGADLRGADLRDADLRGADLRGASLLGADLREADLRGAELSGSFSNVFIDDTIIHPITTGSMFQADLSKFVDYPDDTDFVIGYRTKYSCRSYMIYNSGHEYKASVFDVESFITCSAGLYLAPSCDDENIPKGEQVRVVALKSEILKCGTKYRALRFYVL